MIGFAEFLLALGQRPPYAWQTRLAERCAADGPPSVIALPTGVGKTTTVEVLVWALAKQADRPARERTVGVRTVWAIDRRILVDQVHTRACELADRLKAALADSHDPLHDLADRLARIGGADVPLTVTRWRGGIDEERQLFGPLQPHVITSTVAQIGSRLLFRGYGVAEGSLAMEAGLAAADTTICLDEAHLAEPFRQTARAVADHREAAAGSVGLPSLRLVTLTATPHGEDPDTFTLCDADRVELNHLLSAPKRARIVEPGEQAGARECVQTLVQEILGHRETGADPIACVLNTVQRARDVFTALKAAVSADEVDVALLIGPQRPADREGLLAKHGGKLLERETDDKPLICVATQTFEVGLDADVQALVTESASAVALVQRLGRLNRSGASEGQASIVRDEQTWLYQGDEQRAWEWLEARVEDDGMVDVSIAALDGSWPESQTSNNAPMLTDDVIGLLAQTSPRPGRYQEPDVEAFLRGVKVEPVSDVAVCWRADLRPELTDAQADGYRELLLQAAPPHRQELVTLSLTAAHGLIAARYGGRRAGGAIRAALGDGDLDAPPPDVTVADVAPAAEGVPFVVIRRGEVVRGTLDSRDREAVHSTRLGPGDVVVLPTSAGGCDEYGLAPADPRDTWANDVAPDVRTEDRFAPKQPGQRPAPVRITPEAVKAACGDRLPRDTWQRVASACRRAEKELDNLRGATARRDRIAALVETLAAELPGHAGLAKLAQMHSQSAGGHVVLRIAGPTDAERVPLFDENEPLEDESKLDAGAADQADPDTAEDRTPTAFGRPLKAAWILVPVSSHQREREDRSSVDRQLPSIDAHARAVCGRLEREHDRLGLAGELRDSLLLAALVHDHGKADPRFQAFFHRGSRPVGADPVAKSEFGTDDLATERIARRVAGLPARLRHEIASVAVLADALAKFGAIPGYERADPELVLHLVGVHHGRGRPIPPMPSMRSDSIPAERFHIDAAGVAGEAFGDGRDGWQEGMWLRRFSALNAHYGAWSLAYLEALLMLADRTVSAEGG